MIRSAALSILWFASVVTVFANSSSTGDSRGARAPGLFGTYPPTGRPALYFSTTEEYHPNGKILVQVKTPRGWESAGDVSEDQYLRTRIVDLSRWRGASPLIVRLLVEAKGKAHLDAILVDGRPPNGLDPRQSRKLSAADNDILSFDELAGKPFTFSPISKGGLAIVARIEPAVIGTTPIQFPLENTYTSISLDSAFYTYRIDSRRWSPAIDGSLHGEDLGTSRFTGTMPFGSGHPQSLIYGWVGNDERFLYALVDVTPDNTEDGGTDYCTLYVKAGSSVREFKVSTGDERWGKTGFEYTDRVAWQHKVYEIAVPLAELGTVQGQEIEIAFAAYGTMAVIGLDLSPDPNGVDPDSGASGTTFTFTVQYADAVHIAAPMQSNLWIDLNGNGLEGQAPFGPTPTGNPPWWVLTALGLGSGALVLALLRKRLALAPLGLVVALAFGSCQVSTPQTTQETYSMTPSGSDWATGVVFTATVKLEKDPGSYSFQFLFKDSTGADVTSGLGYTTAKSVTIN